MKFEYFVVVFFLIISFSSCKEIFDDILDDNQVLVISPADSLDTDIYTHTFWWEKMEGANHYNLQIVSPSFSQVSEVVLDSNIQGTRHTKTLAPGTYQWRVRAENPSSQSRYVTRTIIVREGSMDGQSIRLISPENNRFYNSSSNTVNLSWEQVPGAVVYRVNIDSVTTSGAPQSFRKITTDRTSHSFIIHDNAIFKWRIQAVADSVAGDLTEWSEERTFTYDDIAPGPAILQAPSDMAQVSASVSLQWQKPADNDISHYKIYIYTNSTGANLEGYPISSLTLPNPLATNYSFTTGLPGQQYYWRISAIDKAGNEGELPDMRSFNINF